MIKIITILLILFPIGFKEELQPLMYPNDDMVTGYLTGYDDGVMNRAIDYYDSLNYQSWCGFECRQEAELDGFVVVAYCERIGDIATLIVDSEEYTVLVADCIAQEHIVEGNIFDPDRGYILELDYNLFNSIDTRYGTLIY